MADNVFTAPWKFSNGVLMSSKFIIFVTAHDPLSRFDCLLETLKGYDELTGKKDIYIYIDYAHKEDKDNLKELLKPNLKTLDIEVEVAPPEYEGFSLTWAHKNHMKLAIEAKAYDFYIYTENDMLFNSEHFIYWYRYKDFLKPLNLEPGFCRYEYFDGRCVPFDNHRRWKLNGPTKSVWGDRPYQVESFLNLSEDSSVCFASLGNPYMGMMILDQDMGEQYIKSDSFDPVKSFELTKFRCWPIADRSSMGLAFEGLTGTREHRRVVPLIRTDGVVHIHPCALLEHRDTKYSKLLKNELGSVLDISELFDVS